MKPSQKENVFNQMLLELALAAGVKNGKDEFDLFDFLNATVSPFVEKLQCESAVIVRESRQVIQILWPEDQSLPESTTRPAIIAKDLMGHALSFPGSGYQTVENELVHYVFPFNGSDFFVLSRHGRFDDDTPDQFLPVVILLARTYHLLTEVNHLKHKEEELKHERNLLRTIIDNIPDPVYVKDIEGRKILLNQAEADLLGASSIEEVLGKTDADFYPEAAAKQTMIEDQSIIQSTSPSIRKEGMLITRSGEEIWFEGNKIPYFDSNGKISGIVGISHNITNRKIAQKQIQENADKYQSIFNSFIDLYYRTDLKGNILVLSPSVYQLSGYTPEELIGKSVAQIYADIQSRNKMMELLYKKGAINDYENLLIRKNGTPVPVSITAHLIKDSDGQPLHIEGTIRDITDRKESEEKLEKLLHLQNLITQLATEFINIPVENSDEAVDSLLQLIGEQNQIDRVYIFSYDFGSKTMSNTHEWCAPGVHPEKDHLQLIPFSLLPTWVETHESGEMLIVPDVSKIDKGSSMRQILEPQDIKTLITIPMILDGECLGFVGFDSVKIVKPWSKEEITFLQLLADLLCNVTDRKRTEQSLKTREAYLKAVFNNVPYQMWLKDIHGRYLLVNHPFLDYFSFTEHDNPIGKTAQELWTQEISQRFIDQDNEVMVTRQLKTVEEQLDFHGKKVWLEIYRAPIIDPNGELLGTTGIARDITSRITADRELKKATEEARAASIAKTRFLANMSHEIRTPLNAIMGMVRLLRESKVEPAQIKLLDNMKISSENLLSIINVILDFSKIESGQIEIERTDFNLHELVHRVYDANDFRAEEKSIKLRYSVDERIHEFLKGDPVRLQQILNNLVSNAIKFTKDGIVELRCELAGKQNGKDSILFMVEDTGIGISPENQTKIFNSFQQEDESITRTYGGTGLGLAISKQLVELMGGKLCVQSIKNKGSQFYFTIELELGLGVKPEIKQVSAIGDILSLNGIKVLLVEDNKFNQFIAQAILEKWSAKTTLCENGEQAVEKLRIESFDLILMDIQMPVMDGITASSIIREELKLQTPILALTANVIKGIVERCEEAGMQGYISKPFDENELYAKIRSVVAITNDGKDKNPEQAEPIRLCDISRLVKMVGNDGKILKRMIEKFLEVTPDYNRELSEASDNHDVDAIERTSHKIKSAIDLVSNDTMRNLIKTINDIGKTGVESDELYMLIQKFMTYFTILCDQLRMEIKEP